MGYGKHGRLQGVLTSLTSMASTITPLAISEIYFASRHVSPGLVWMLSVSSYSCACQSYLQTGLRQIDRVKEQRTGKGSAGERQPRGCAKGASEQEPPMRSAG